MYQQDSYREPPAARRGERGYPLFFFRAGPAWLRGVCTTVLFVVVAGGFYIWYNRFGAEPVPDGMVGILYALIGTAFFVLAGVLFSLRRRARKRAVGQLNASLNWHMFLAVMAIAALYMHSFGHFEALTGPLALYSLIALSLCGLAGRMLDRFLPRLIAASVSSVLTNQGEDGMATVSQRLEAIVAHNTRADLHGFAVGAPRQQSARQQVSQRTDDALSAPWDLAYISLEPTQQELDRDAPRYRFVPDKKSALTRPGAMIPGADEHLAAIQEMEAAMKSERLYRTIIRGWRVFHIMLAFVTLVLVVWHIIFGLHILYPTIVPYPS